MKNSLPLFVIACAVAAGCQSTHKPAPVAQTPATTQSDVAITPEATPPTTVVVTPPATRVVATGPATTPASTAPAAMPARVYVAADADQATRARNWPVSVNYYPSGHAIAGPVYRVIAPPPRSNRVDDVVFEDLFATAISLPQMLVTPVWMFFTKPMTPVEYHGEQFAPSYTVDHPLPYYEDENVPGMFKMKR